MSAETTQKPAGYTACLITCIFYIIGPFTMGILNDPVMALKYSMNHLHVYS